MQRATWRFRFTFTERASDDFIRLSGAITLPYNKNIVARKYEHEDIVCVRRG